MNFYVGKSDLKVNYKDYNVRFSDELSEYLYQNQDKIKIDLSWLFMLDPYENDYIPLDMMNKVQQSCRDLLNITILDNYRFPLEAKETMKDMADMAKKAMNLGSGLVSIGD